MGNTSSKPFRKLGDTISKDSATKLKKSPGVNPAPPKRLKEKFETDNLKEGQSKQTDEQGPGTGVNDTNNKEGLDFNLEKSLFKESERKVDQSNQAKSGKDGSDPHLGSLDVVGSFNKLGKTIKTSDEHPHLNPQFSSLRRLKSRQQVYEKGELESKARHSHKDNARSILRTMVPPQALSSILADLNDSKVSLDNIYNDYQLSPGFLTNLDRLKIAKTYVEHEEDKIDHEKRPEDETSSLQNKKVSMDDESLKKKKSRLGIEDE